MRFKVKTSDVDTLKKYGFKLPEEWLESGALDGTNVSDGCLMNGCFHMFKMDEENPSKIAVDDEVENPLLEGWIDTRDNRNILWFNVMPWGTYYSGMDELLPMMDVIYRMAKDGLLERIDEDD